MIEEVVEAIKQGKKVLICGNGGLAAESEHFAAELMGKYAFDVYVPCIALTGNSSLITALANDVGFQHVFSWQVKILGNEGDILIAMTTSASKNIIEAINIANDKGMITLLVCGENIPDVDFDLCYQMTSKDTADVQNMAIMFLHNFAYEIKRRLQCSSSIPTTD